MGPASRRDANCVVTESRHDANFVVTDCVASCCNDILLAQLITNLALWQLSVFFGTWQYMCMGNTFKLH